MIIYHGANILSRELLKKNCLKLNCSLVLLRNVKEEKWQNIIWCVPCFDISNLQSVGWYGAPRSWVSLTPAASPTPTPASTQRPEDYASSGGTCCKFFQPTRRPHEGSPVSRDSPDTTVLKYGALWSSGLAHLADALDRHQRANGF